MKMALNLNKSFFEDRNIERSISYFPGFQSDGNGTFDENEEAILNHVLEHEHFLIEQRGVYVEPTGVHFNWNNIDRDFNAKIELSRELNAFKIPVFHDFSQIDILGGETIQYIVYVSNYDIWELLASSEFPGKDSLLLVSGSGLPRFCTRKFLAKTAKSLDVPVVVFADCDEWGFFICSMLYRGSVVPGTFDHLQSLDNVLFGGIKVEDASCRFKKLQYRCDQDFFHARLTAMLKYPFFQSETWQHQLEGLLKLTARVRLSDVASSMDKTSFVDFFCDSLMQ